MKQAPERIFFLLPRATRRFNKCLSCRLGDTHRFTQFNGRELFPVDPVVHRWDRHLQSLPYFFGGELLFLHCLCFCVSRVSSCSQLSGAAYNPVLEHWGEKRSCFT